MRKLIIPLLLLFIACNNGPKTTSSQFVSGKYKVKFEGEITIEPLDGSGPIDTVVVPPTPTPSNFLVGSNTFPYTPLNLYTYLGMKTLRFYCPWHWFGSPGGKLYVEPMKQAWTTECSGLDDLLTKCKNQGIDPLLCFNQCPEWLRPGASSSDRQKYIYGPTALGTGGVDYPPTPPGANLLDKKSYKEYIDFLEQITMRYGRVKYDLPLMKVDQTQQYPNQPKNQPRSGLDLLKMIEIQNEPDHWFDGFQSEKYMDAEEHACMLSACYDAIKAKDPSMLVVMGGITDFNPWYLQRMIVWWKANRPNKDIPCDYFNVHHYSNFKNKTGTQKPDWFMNGACYPEEDANFGTIVEVVNLARAHGKKVMVSEFGADSKGKDISMMYAAPRDGMADEQVQSLIITKSIKAYQAAGVDIVYIFTGPDGSSGNNYGQFSRSGIFTAKEDGYKKKVVYEALKQVIQQVQ